MSIIFESGIGHVIGHLVEQLYNRKMNCVSSKIGYSLHEFIVEPLFDYLVYNGNIISILKDISNKLLTNDNNYILPDSYSYAPQYGTMTYDPGVFESERALTNDNNYILPDSYFYAPQYGTMTYDLGIFESEREGILSCIQIIIENKMSELNTVDTLLTIMKFYTNYKVSVSINTSLASYLEVEIIPIKWSIAVTPLVMATSMIVSSIFDSIASTIDEIGFMTYYCAPYHNNYTNPYIHPGSLEYGTMTYYQCTLEAGEESFQLIPEE